MIKILAAEGRSHLVYYVRKEMKILCEVYMQEARWRKDKYIPPYEEYLKISGVSVGLDLGLVLTFLNMGEIATNEAFEWARQHPKSQVASGFIGRIMNDMGGNKFQQRRDHIASAVECFMKQYGVSEEEARKQLNKHVEKLWKDVNEGMSRPHAISMPLLANILHQTRVMDVIYKGEDGYTVVSQIIKNKTAMVLIDPVPI